MYCAMRAEDRATAQRAVAIKARGCAVIGGTDVSVCGRRGSRRPKIHTRALIRSRPIVCAFVVSSVSLVASSAHVSPGQWESQPTSPAARKNQCIPTQIRLYNPVPSEADVTAKERAKRQRRGEEKGEIYSCSGQRSEDARAEVETEEGTAECRWTSAWVHETQQLANEGTDEANQRGRANARRPADVASRNPQSAPASSYSPRHPVPAAAPPPPPLWPCWT